MFLRCLSLASLAALTLAACGDTSSGGREASQDGVVAPTKDGSVTPVASPTLQTVKRRGRLNCGVHEGLVGFAYTDNRGQWRGFDVDFCRALAAAVLGDPDAVRFVPLGNRDRLAAVRDGRVDVLWRNTSWTMTRDAGEGVAFAGVNYYDGQGFLVRRSLNLTSATELNGARICVQGASTSQLNLADWFQVRGIVYTPVVLSGEEDARQAYARDDCDAFTADVSALAAARTTLPNPEQHAILPDIISKEPLGPITRRGDEGWTTIVRWTLNGLILAEELGVTQSVARGRAEPRDPRARRLLGLDGEFGPLLGLEKTWARDALSAVGNYGEIFERNVGAESPLDLARGLNAQWNAEPGGLMYALPIR
ncbi:MAG: amino acid ABC transporter substrate-binding protein [Caulobacteraceae bacterium]|nr:amino acid ABC transporter substrate-binding protein [Caulobacteraceae bacterium]